MEFDIDDIVEFVGIRSNMYSYVKHNGKNEKTAKGIRKYAIKKNITDENHKGRLLNGKQMLHSMRTIRSDHHQIGSYQLNKMSLSCFDDKRFILEDGIHSYAYGRFETGASLGKQVIRIFSRLLYDYTNFSTACIKFCETILICGLWTGTADP